MQCEVSIPDLKKAMATVKQSVRRTSSLPILHGAHLAAEDGRLRVTGTDLDLTTIVDIPASVAAAGALVVGHALLAKLVSKGKGSISLSLGSDDDLIAVNGITTRLRTLPLAEWPRVGNVPDGEEVLLDPADLAAVLAAASTDDGRPILTGVQFDGEHIAATDSYRLHVVTDHTANYPKLLVPRAAIAQVVKLGKPAVMRRCGEDNVQITAGEVTWYSRLIEGEFPNWKQLVPAATPNRAIFDRAELIAKIEACAAVVRDASTPVRIRFNENVAVCTVMTQELDQSSADVPVQYDGEADLVIAFNPEYLITCLKAGVGDKITFGVVDGLRPALIGDCVNPGRYRRIIMPVRVT